jgi:hypothetical protein
LLGGINYFQVLLLEDHRKFLLENFYFNDLNKLNLEKIKLKKTSKSNQYLYKSKGFNILRWHFQPEIIFLIIYGEKNISLETNEKLIKGLGLFSDIIQIEINFIILKNQENSFTAQRSITLGFKKKPNFLRFIPNKILKKLLSQALDLIAKRVDKKLLLKLSALTEN